MVIGPVSNNAAGVTKLRWILPAMQSAADLPDKTATVRKNNNSNKKQTSAQLPDEGRDRECAQGDAT